MKIKFCAAKDVKKLKTPDIFMQNTIPLRVLRTSARDPPALTPRDNAAQAP